VDADESQRNEERACSSDASMARLRSLLMTLQSHVAVSGSDRACIARCEAAATEAEMRSISAVMVLLHCSYERPWRCFGGTGP
jgi:hypothetical protein